MCFHTQALSKANDTDPVRTSLFHFKAVPRTLQLQQVVGREIVRHTTGVCSRRETDRLSRGIGLDRALMPRNIEEKADRLLAASSSSNVAVSTALRSVGTNSI